MADPLRIAGSPLGILSAGLTVAQGLYDYYQLYRGQSENVAHTAKKLKRLLDILESLRALLDHGNSQSRGCELPDKVRSSINDCEESIQELDEQLTKIRKTSDKDAIESLRASCRRVVYPFREGTLRKLEDDIADSVDGLSLALQLLQKGNLDSLQDDVEELLKLARATHSDNQIRSWINAPDPSINFNASVKKKHPGTGN